jgi:hypothetical protein
MQTLITRLAQRHHFDLAQPNAHYKLYLSGFMPLVIERLNSTTLSLAHYYTQNGDLIADPDVVFFTGYAEWVPIEITQPATYLVGRGPLGGYQRVATLTPDRRAIATYQPKPQADLTSFTNFWAANLRHQGWLLHATPQPPTVTVTPTPSRINPPPSNPPARPAR